MASNSTFYNWVFSFVIFSLILLGAAEVVTNMAAPYQNFTSVNASPTFYVQELANLSVLDEINGTANRALETLNPSNQTSSGFVKFIQKNAPVLIDISTFGIVVFQSVGTVVSAVFKSLSIIPNTIKLLAETMGIPSYIVDSLLVLAIFTIVFTMVRAVLKTRNI